MAMAAAPSRKLHEPKTLLPTLPAPTLPWRTRSPSAWALGSGLGLGAGLGLELGLALALGLGVVGTTPTPTPSPAPDLARALGRAHQTAHAVLVARRQRARAWLALG